MNGEEIPGLLNAMGEWVRKNRDPNTGLVFGATVREPVEQHTVKTYGFTCDDEDKPFNVIVWQFGNVNVETADLTKSHDAPDADVFCSDEFEFEEVAQVIEKLDSFFQENPPCGSRSAFAAITLP